MRAVRHVVRSLLFGAAFLAAAASTAVGQAVRGRVLDAETQQPIAGVRIRLRSANDDVSLETVTNEEGLFYVAGRGAAQYRIEADHLAYSSIQTQLLAIRFQEMVVVDIRMSRAVLQLDPLTVTARRRDPRHDATYEGLYARRSQFPPVGGQRVVLKNDPEMTSAIVINDVLQWFNIGDCRVVYWNGMLVNNQLVAQMWIDHTSVRDLEGLEFYRTPIEAPPAFRDVPNYLRDNFRCSVIALWPRRPDLISAWK